MLSDNHTNIDSHSFHTQVPDSIYYVLITQRRLCGKYFYFFSPHSTHNDFDNKKPIKHLQYATSITVSVCLDIKP